MSSLKRIGLACAIAASISGCATDAAPGTCGELLVAAAEDAACRARDRGCSDDEMEAISELATRWLLTRDDGRRVWDDEARSTGTIKRSIGNQRISMHRREQRQERNRRVAALVEQAPGQEAHLELGEVVGELGDDEELVALAAMGHDSAEIAERLGMSRSAVRQRLSRLRRRLALRG